MNQNSNLNPHAPKGITKDENIELSYLPSSPRGGELGECSSCVLNEEEILLLTKRAELRSKIYMLLSTFYLERPTEKIVKGFKTNKFFQTLKNAVSNTEGDMKVGLKIFELYVNSINDLPETEVAEDLAIDFTRLFRGIKKGYGPPPPYESVWKGEGKIMGEWAHKVLEMYHQAGIGMDMKDENPDYIGIELKFLAMLCFEEALKWGNDISKARRFIEIQKSFLEEHIQAWVPDFVVMAVNEAKTGFYKAVLKLTNGFLESESRLLTKGI